jgi:hypothetical protein
MTIIEAIVNAYPELENADFLKEGIILQDDSDGKGSFIAAWTYLKPIPNELKVGK